MKFSIYNATYMKTPDVINIELELSNKNLAELIENGAIRLEIINQEGIIKEVICVKLLRA